MPVTLNEQRTNVFLDRYALKDSQGQPVEKTVEEMWDRVAGAVALSELDRIEFRDILQDFRFVPGGRILAGAGTNTEVTYYNCYVIPIETKQRRELRARKATPLEIARNPEPGSDSREAILDSISVMVDIMSRGGGVGINWSVLRPKGTHLKRVNGTTSGPVSWMDVASHAVQTVTQGGSRRGAAMFMLDDWHPDVLEFIDAKRNLDAITGANVSVAISDAFMAAVDSDGDWNFEFPDTSHGDYNTQWDGDLARWKAAGLPTIIKGTIKARELWRRIAESAWHNGEPGVVFLDRYNKESTGLGEERIICVNPCGEQGLGAYAVCNLGSMNLDAYIELDHQTLKRSFNYVRFFDDAQVAVRFLDNVIDKNYYFLPENEEIQKRLRRMGLGVMGLADAMLALGIRYGSKESVTFTERVFSTLKTAAISASSELANEKGAAPAWDASMLERPFLKDFINSSDEPEETQHLLWETGLRNIFLLTQAPTGSTSILTNVNSGIEPYFAFEYTRKDRTGVHKVYAPAILKYRDEATERGPEWVTSQDVSVEEHIAVQAAVQKYLDSSVSKTINAPNNHTVEDVEKAFTLAYESGLKGLAYFRDGNGRDQVLYKEGDDNEQQRVRPDDGEVESLRDEVFRLTETIASLEPYIIEYKRPRTLAGSTTKTQTRAGTAYVTVNRDPQDLRPVEVFFNVGKAGSEVAALAEALGRLASLALRKGATLGGVANQLDGVGGSSQFNRAIPHAIAQALTEQNIDHTIVPVEDTVAINREPISAAVTRYDICPECHNASLSYQEGCSKCAACGYSAC